VTTLTCKLAKKFLVYLNAPWYPDIFEVDILKCIEMFPKRSFLFAQYQRITDGSRVVKLDVGREPLRISGSGSVTSQMPFLPPTRSTEENSAHLQ